MINWPNAEYSIKIGKDSRKHRGFEPDGGTEWKEAWTVTAATTNHVGGESAVTQSWDHQRHNCFAHAWRWLAINASKLIERWQSVYVCTAKYLSDIVEQCVSADNAR